MGGLEEIKNEAVDLVRNYCLLAAATTTTASDPFVLLAPP